ncbi:MAG TPA: hypothetical protein VLS49_16635 [Usitatibacter sp.]|nr:hypothetical protein [Usitatibacter sp.]
MKAPISADRTPMAADESAMSLVLMDADSMRSKRLLRIIGAGSAGIGACGDPHGRQGGIAKC